MYYICILSSIIGRVVAANYCQWTPIISVDNSGNYLGYDRNGQSLFPSSLCSGTTCTFAGQWGSSTSSGLLAPASGRTYVCDGNVKRDAITSTSTLDRYYLCTCNPTLPRLQGPQGTFSTGLSNPATVYTSAGPWPVQEIYCMTTFTRVTSVSVGPNNAACSKFISCSGTTCMSVNDGTSTEEDCTGGTTGPSNLLPDWTID